MSDPLLVLLAVAAAAVLGALGCYALSSALVMGGRSGQFLEAHRWLYPLALVLGLVLVAGGVTSGVWPVASLGGALAVVAAGRALWLNV